MGVPGAAKGQALTAVPDCPPGMLTTGERPDASRHVPAYSCPVTYPESGPDDPAEESRVLIEDFKDSWCIWYTDRWHSSSREIFLYAPAAETAAGMREQLEKKMAGAIPRLRAQLKEAEAAAVRLRSRERGP
jgi:hypothetical protein